jgi:uncharacterized protein (TIGR03435 family)
MIIVRSAAIALLASTVSAATGSPFQSAAAIVTDGPRFDVASIRPSPPDDAPGIRPLLPGGRFTAVALTTKDLIRIAYGATAALLPSQVAGGPDWLDKERFTITAASSTLAAPDASPRTVTMMLQRLLADRFQVRVHLETRELPVYAMMLARTDGRLGPQLRAATAGACRSALVQPTTQQGIAPPCGFTRVAPGLLAGNNIPMSLLSGVLADRPEVGRVVLDRSGLAGGFDMNLEYTPDAAAPNADTKTPGLFTALQEQLGLKLESTRGPVEVLVVDAAERPADN